MMDVKVNFLAFCLVVATGHLLVPATAGLECYQCTRLTVTDYAGQSSTDVDAAINASIATIDEDCQAGQLTDSLAGECEVATDICGVMQASFTMQYNGATLTVAGQNGLCRDNTTDDVDCQNSGEGFESLTTTIDDLLEAHGDISDVTGFSGHLCLCVTDKCNTDTDTLLGMIDTTTGMIDTTTGMIDTTTTQTPATEASSSASYSTQKAVIPGIWLILTIAGFMLF